MSTNSRPRRLWAVIATVAVVGVAATLTAIFIASPDSPTPSSPPSPTVAARPDVAALAGPLADQELNWEECTWDKEAFAAPLDEADVSNVECATIKVPQDWHHPDPDRTWDVRMSMARNIDSAAPDYRTTVIAHPGGPVTPGLSFSTTIQHQTPQLRATTNYVSFDQRGLGQSSHAECAYEYRSDASVADQVQAMGEACAQDPDVATMTTEQAAYDMDFIRHLLGVETVTYMGYSYGTWLGTWFGGLFPDHIERMVLDSSVDSTQESIQTLYESAHHGRDRQFRLHMMNFIARNDATYGLGTDPEAIWERYFAATSSPEMAQAAPLAWTTTGTNNAFATAALYPDAGHLVRLLIAEGEAATKPVVPLDVVGRIIDEMPGLDDTRRAGAHAALLQSAALTEQPPADTPETVRATSDELIEFTRCTDGEWTQGLEYWQQFNQRTTLEAPLSAQFGLLSAPPACAFWPTESAMPELDDRFPETIVLQSELDSMTPFEQGRASGLGLPNTSLIAVDNENAHSVFPYGTAEVDRPVVDFLLGGDRPEQTIVAAGKPIRSEESTFESWTAINPDGEHAETSGQFTDPAIPTRTAELSVPTSK